ncbi:tetratricopeptide repeat protein [Aquimarina muelleri]|uniref:tetratricopeptide repeat protein n=1 Tax=Aquimarina muelleri TaxID=279356 RepID=UPI003F68410E
MSTNDKKYNYNLTMHIYKSTMKTMLLLALLLLCFSCNSKKQDNSNQQSDVLEITPKPSNPTTLNESIAIEKSTIQILSAVIKDKPIIGAEVIFQRSGKTSSVSITDTQGIAKIPNGFNDDSETVIIIKKEGYSTLVAKCACKGLTYAISPKMKNLDGVRVVLNWGEAPMDLDLHLRYEDKHVFFRNMEETTVNLDVDDTDSYGPETITIDKKKYGVEYSFFIHDFTNYELPHSKELSNSDAKVYVYIGSSLIKTFYIPSHVTGNIWDVFKISAEGEIITINKFYQSTITNLEHLMKSNNYQETNFEATSNRIDITEAKEVNKLGEKQYHNNNLEESIVLYKKSIELNPEFGQAYSNLGLAYYKNGNKAEAIWANRKAIALASGTNKPSLCVRIYKRRVQIFNLTK